MKKIVCILLCCAMFSSGCCSIFTPEPQTISVNSKPEGAKIDIGPYSGTAPYNVSIPRGKDYVIMAKLDGKTQTASLDKNIEGIYWINILFWPGLIIDLATGKMWRYEPTNYSFDFTD